MKLKVLEYCVLNTVELNKLTTPEIAQRLKQEFPEVPVTIIYSAFCEWCKRYRPGIAVG